MLVVNKERGNKAEQKFFGLFKGSVIRYPTKDQDMLDHWDGSVDDVKFDVKALKKVNFRDDLVDQKIHWVELTNVKGNIGWLYGKADKIAFELFLDWLIVDRLKLVDFMERKFLGETSSTPCFNKAYQRQGTSDQIVLVKTFDLFTIKDCLISKNIQ